jgi:hypothetical protein
MENFLKKKYNLKDDLNFSELLNKQQLNINNHNDTKSFWNFSNDIAIYIFNENNYNYDNIINSNLCHFCKPHGGPNIGGLLIANKYNNLILEQILQIDNNNISNLESINTNFVESNHYIFLTYLLSILYDYDKDKEYNIIDIGGGYGNIRRLLLKLLNIKTYTIFDIDSVLFYNKQFYNNTNNQTFDFKENEIINKNDKGIYNISLDFKNTFIYNYNKSIDVVIATHSLSELDMDDFYWYLINIISKSNIVLYATQINTSSHNPVSGEISLLKIDLIKKYMDIIIEIGQPGQDKDCKLYIFKNKNII